MNIMKKHILTLCLTPLLFVACGGEVREQESTTLNESNYLKVAKSVYANQSGKNTDITLVSAPPPGETMDANTLYLSKLVKPRNDKVSEVVVQQDGSTLSISVDTANKYATLTLSGASTAVQTVDMKTFTSAQ